MHGTTHGRLAQAKKPKLTLALPSTPPPERPSATTEFFARAEGATPRNFDLQDSDHFNPHKLLLVAMTSHNRKHATHTILNYSTSRTKSKNCRRRYNGGGFTQIAPCRMIPVRRQCSPQWWSQTTECPELLAPGTGHKSQVQMTNKKSHLRKAINCIGNTFI